MTPTDPAQPLKKRQMIFLLNEDHFTSVAACHKVIAGTRINKT